MNLTINLSNLTEVDSCAHIRGFEETLANKYKFAVGVLAIIHLAQLIVLGVYERKEKKGKIDKDQMKIVLDFMQLSSYVKLISILFLVGSVLGGF